MRRKPEITRNKLVCKDLKRRYIREANGQTLYKSGGDK